MFDKHIKKITPKLSKTIGLLRKLNNRFPRSSLTTIYKLFLRSFFHYSDVIFYKAYNSFFKQGLESLQYKTSLALAGATKGSSTRKLYLELGLESLQNRPWFRKLCAFYKIVKEQSSKYLTQFLQIAIHTKQEMVKTWLFPSLK